MISFDKFYPPFEAKQYPFKWNRKKRWFAWCFVILPKKFAAYERNKANAKQMLENQFRYLAEHAKNAQPVSAKPEDLLKSVRIGACKTIPDYFRSEAK